MYYNVANGFVGDNKREKAGIATFGIFFSAIGPAWCGFLDRRKRLDWLENFIMLHASRELTTHTHTHTGTHIANTAHGTGHGAQSGPRVEKRPRILLWCLLTVVSCTSGCSPDRRSGGSTFTLPGQDPCSVQVPVPDPLPARSSASVSLQDRAGLVGLDGVKVGSGHVGNTHTSCVATGTLMPLAAKARGLLLSLTAPAGP